jgi:hypothetical protein
MTARSINEQLCSRRSLCDAESLILPPVPLPLGTSTAQTKAFAKNSGQDRLVLQRIQKRERKPSTLLFSARLHCAKMSFSRQMDQAPILG